MFSRKQQFERAYGWSIVVIGYQDKAETLKEPVDRAEKIVSLQAYAPTMITEVKIDENRIALVLVCLKPIGKGLLRGEMLKYIVPVLFIGNSSFGQSLERLKD